MLQIPTIATGAIAQDIGPRTVGSCMPSPPTEAEAISQAAPHVLGLEQDQESSLTMPPPSDNNDSQIAHFIKMFADSHCNRLTTKVKPDLKEVFLTLLKSRADFTLKKYEKEILKFIEWCNLSNVRPVPPLHASLAVAYLQHRHVKRA